jgi:hypothetical protein
MWELQYRDWVKEWRICKWWELLVCWFCVIYVLICKDSCLAIHHWQPYVSSVKKQSIDKSLNDTKNQFTFHLHRYNVCRQSGDSLKRGKQTNNTYCNTILLFYNHKVLYFNTTVSSFSCPLRVRCNTIFCIQFTILPICTVCCTAININGTAQWNSSEQ